VTWIWVPGVNPSAYNRDLALPPPERVAIVTIDPEFTSHKGNEFIALTSDPQYYKQIVLYQKIPKVSFDEQ
jgi:hypothetical protein